MIMVTLFCIGAIVACAVLASDGGPQTVMAFIIAGLGVVLGYSIRKKP